MHLPLSKFLSARACRAVSHLTLINGKRKRFEPPWVVGLMNATRFERMTLWMSRITSRCLVSKGTGITRATTAPRILEWIRRYLVIPVAGDVIVEFEIYIPWIDCLAISLVLTSVVHSPSLIYHLEQGDFFYHGKTTVDTRTTQVDELRYLKRSRPVAQANRPGKQASSAITTLLHTQLSSQSLTNDEVDWWWVVVVGNIRYAQFQDSWSFLCSFGITMTHLLSATSCFEYAYSWMPFCV